MNDHLEDVEFFLDPELEPALSLVPKDPERVDRSVSDVDRDLADDAEGRFERVFETLEAAHEA
jgi:hypothetical protein